MVRSAVLLGSALLMTPRPAAAEPITYTLDAASSKLYAVVYIDPSALAAGTLGHDHTVVASEFDGTVRWDIDDPSQCKVDISFPVTALIIDPAGFREREGLDPDGAIGDGSKAKVVRNIQGRSQVDASNHPTISYSSTSCSAASGDVQVSGTLEIHGVGHQLTVSMNVTPAADSFTAKGMFEANHTDFGFKPYTNLAGALRNLDALKFVVEVTGTP